MKEIFSILQKALIRRGSIINEINQCSHLEWSFFLLLLISFNIIESANFRNWIIMEMIIISRHSDSLSLSLVLVSMKSLWLVVLHYSTLHSIAHNSVWCTWELLQSFYFYFYFFAKPVRSEVEGEQEVMKEKKDSIERSVCIIIIPDLHSVLFFTLLSL